MVNQELLNKVAQAKHIENAEGLELFSKVTGLIHATTEMMQGENADWYVPQGAFIPTEEAKEQDEQEPVNVTKSEVEAHKGEPVVEGVNDQYDLDKDNDIDDDDKDLAASEIVVEEEAEYEYIHDEETWNASFANGALKDYYANNPDEDRWNVIENRAGNFNDKVYTVTLSGDNGIYQFAAHWETDDVQSIKNLADETEVYYLDMFNTLDANEHPLFTDVELSESAGKSATFTAINWNDETCPHCWEGAVNAPGAVLPWSWIAIKTPEGFKGIVRLTYNGTTEDLEKGQTIISTTTKFGVDFDESKFKASLIRK